MMNTRFGGARYSDPLGKVDMGTSHQLDRRRPATGKQGVLPENVIIGPWKGGTRSLHCSYWAYRRGEGWPRANSPAALYGCAFQPLTRRRPVIGEASPYCLFHQHAPARVKASFPELNLLAPLRDAVERTVASYQHQVRQGRESVKVAEAFDSEQDRLATETARVQSSGTYNGEAHRPFSCRARGLHSEQLERLTAVFPREQFVILHTHDCFDRTDAVLTQVLDFLGLRHWQRPEGHRFNAAHCQRLDRTVHARLVALVAAHNQRPHELVGRDFGWPR